ncbi:MAG: efflux transporter periplasmic adaptor subunit, partial [Sediminibacterium sp.]|nr:efflux transporter periplasmic adaptor subunit [Sediminibacterium sp.]
TNKDIDEVCFVLDKNNIVRKKIVKTGIQDINNIEIISGLQVGDEVVTGPYLEVSKLLKDSTKVKVVTKEEMYSGVKKN